MVVGLIVIEGVAEGTISSSSWVGSLSLACSFFYNCFNHPILSFLQPLIDTALRIPSNVRAGETHGEQKTQSNALKTKIESLELFISIASTFISSKKDLAWKKRSALQCQTWRFYLDMLPLGENSMQMTLFAPILRVLFCPMLRVDCWFYASLWCVCWLCCLGLVTTRYLFGTLWEIRKEAQQ